MKFALYLSIALWAVATTACGSAATKGVVAGAILSGEVYLQGRYGDRPIPQARVQLLQGERVVADTLADQNGRFRFDRVPRGGFELVVTKGDQYSPYSFEAKHKKLLQADDPAFFVNGRYFHRAQLDARQTVLKGRVVSAKDGSPVASADVRTYPETGTNKTNDQGEYALQSDLFEEGLNYAVIVTQNGYDNEMSAAMPVQPAQENEIPPIRLKPREPESPLEHGIPEHSPGEDMIVPGSGQ